MLPTDKQDRKDTPMATGLLDYFPDALAEVARVSKVGNDQHNPGEPLHWAKEKSTDHADCIIRHLVDRGTFDTDGTRHTAKVAWRALALLQTELDGADSWDAAALVEGLDDSFQERLDRAHALKARVEGKVPAPVPSPDLVPERFA